MGISYSSRYSSNVATWQDKFKVVKSLREEIINNADLLTPYERAVKARDLNAYQEAYEPYILGGVLSAWHNACDKALGAYDKVSKARADEVKRFDGQKLAGEMNVVNMLVDNALGGRGLDNDSIKALSGIYEDYMSSGDLHKQRAAGEVFSSLLSRDVGNDLDMKVKANSLLTRAKTDLNEVRSYKPLDKAEDEARRAVEELDGMRYVLLDVDAGLGYTSPNGLPGHSLIIKSINDRVDNTGSRLVVKPRQEG